MQFIRESFFIERLAFFSELLISAAAGRRCKNNSHTCHPDRAKRRKGLKSIG